MLFMALFTRTALPSLHSAGRSEAVAGLGRLCASTQEHELVREVALTAVATLLMDCSPSLVAPLQKLVQQQDFFVTCCQQLRQVAAPPAGSLLQADASFLLDATYSALSLIHI